LRKRPFLKDLLFVRFAEHLSATLARRLGPIGKPEMDAHRNLEEIPGYRLNLLF
jgi:hypothetical protein